LEKYLKQHPEEKGFLLETAHPVKFYDTVESVIQQKIPIPENIKSILNKEKESVLMEPHFEKLKEYLLNKHN